MRITQTNAAAKETLDQPTLASNGVIYTSQAIGDISQTMTVLGGSLGWILQPCTACSKQNIQLLVSFGFILHARVCKNVYAPLCFIDVKWIQV